MNSILLWLDDERDPVDPRWHSYFPIPNPKIVWVKSFHDFAEWLSDNEMPAAICFDHDLGDGPSGFDAAKCLTEHCLNNEHRLPKWNIQSANPIGKQNIASLLRSFQRITEQN